MMAIDSELIREVFGAASQSRPVRSSSERLNVAVKGLELHAWLTPDVKLDLDVQVTDWNADVERALYDALDRDNSLIAGLLLWEWSTVRRTCAAACRVIQS
jgi:hypothetical protein